MSPARHRNPVADGSHVRWGSKDCLLYAVGIGAGADELPYVTENSIGVPQQVFPTFAAVIGEMRVDLLGDIDPVMVVHGGQAITWHCDVPVSAEVEHTDRLVGRYDKGSGMLLVVEREVSSVDGTPLWTSRTEVFVRGAGGFGGERGPSEPATTVPSDRAPDRETTLPTAANQAYLYRLSGDRNPLHSDPEFARLAGFPAPILHGLCTYGISCRALLQQWGDGMRMTHLGGRFTAPVFPGESLTIRSWRVDGDVRFTTSVGDRVVFDRGVARFSPR